MVHILSFLVTSWPSGLKLNYLDVITTPVIFQELIWLMHNAHIMETRFEKEAAIFQNLIDHGNENSSSKPNWSSKAHSLSYSKRWFR